jgi:hypothetical protein
MEDGMGKDRTDRDGIDRRHALECMVWAGTGVLWTVAGGVPRALGLVGDATAAEAGASPFTFLQISDSHIGQAGSSTTSGSSGSGDARG